MKQLFIAPSGVLRDRWRQAFSDAWVVEDLVQMAGPCPGRHRVIWMDVAAVAAADLLEFIEPVVACGSPVVVLSSTPNEAEAFRLLSAGVKGYCHVEAAPEQLREVALVVEHGGLWMPPELTQRVLALSMRVVPTAAPSEPELNELTSRELMVAEQIARGASNREISAVLDIGERTVKAHLSAIFKKLGVRDRVQLALAMNNIPTYSTVN